MATVARSEMRPRGQEWAGAGKYVASPVRFATGTAAAGVAFLIVAALWVSTCIEPSDLDSAACGVPQRALLGVGAPAILLGGAIWAFLCTYRAWRAGEDVWAWQGVGWFLFTIMLITLAMGFPALAGPALGG